MLQASLFDGFAFDLLPFQQDCLTTPEVNISGREVFQAFVVAVVIVVADEGANLRLVCRNRDASRRLLTLPRQA